MRLEQLQPNQWGEVAELIHLALSRYYTTHLNDQKFGTDPAPFRLFPELYESLDPGCCLTAVDETSQKLLGCLFYHPRTTHIGIGIVATHPDSANAGVAKAMVKAVLEKAAGLRLPARLVSSALNLQSFSLYTKLGFVPDITYQDLLLEVPTTGLTQSVPVSPDIQIQPAKQDDLEEIVAMEHHLNGLQRRRDYLHFLKNPKQGWKLWVAREYGQLVGFLGGINHPGIAMVGPGVSQNAISMAALIHHALDTSFRGKSTLWLVPVNQPLLVQQAYSWKAKNTEIHLGSGFGWKGKQNGVTLPSFMPESG